jgi:hypothetical protein
MPYIKTIPKNEIPEQNQVNDNDNIIQIHSVNSRVMKAHYDLYIDLMRRKSPLSRIQREEIAVYVSSLNNCHY